MGPILALGGRTHIGISADLALSAVGRPDEVGELGAAADRELVENVADVGADRAKGHPQQRTDLFVRLALGEGLGDLSLPRSEYAEWPRGVGGVGVGGAGRVGGRESVKSGRPAERQIRRSPRLRGPTQAKWLSP